MSSQLSPKPPIEYLEELMAGYVLDTLSLEQKKEFEAYLQTYPELASQLQQWQEVGGALAHSVEIAPPDRLRQKIQALAQASISQASISQAPVNQASGSQPSASQPLISQLPVSSPSHRRVRWAWMGGGAIAAAGLVALGIQNYQLQQQIGALKAEILKEAKEERASYDFSLKGTKAAETANAKVVVHPYSGKLIVAVENLPTLPEGEAYHVWAFTKDDKKILCGRFNTPESGQKIDLLAINPDDYKSSIKYIRISKEPVVTPPDASRRILVMTSES